jgi:hypothetical protein
MIIDNIQSYRHAVVSTDQAYNLIINGHGDSDELNNCREEEQLRLDGLLSVIKMAIQEAAAEPPHNPFSINGDVNQPSIPNGPPPREDI